MGFPFCVSLCLTDFYPTLTSSLLPPTYCHWSSEKVNLRQKRKDPQVFFSPSLYKYADTQNFRNLYMNSSMNFSIVELQMLGILLGFW